MRVLLSHHTITNAPTGSRESGDPASKSRRVRMKEHACQFEFRKIHNLTGISQIPSVPSFPTAHKWEPTCFISVTCCLDWLDPEMAHVYVM